jgi:arylsulfatase A-like enzyme
MMNLKKLFVFASMTALSATVGSTPLEKTKPNVLFIPIDDLKPMLACYGNDVIKTPNIDRLAERGMVFLNNHCQRHGQA